MITADPVVGRIIGQTYMETPDGSHEPLVRIAYRSFMSQVDSQFRRVQDRVRVHFQWEDPYASYEELCEDVQENGLLRIYRTQDGQDHPLLSREENDRFRAVHDFFGHIGSGRGFDRDGEEAAWVHHSRMFSGLARRAMTTETRGQSSAFTWINEGREFPPQKAVLLPTWMSDPVG